MAIPICPDKNNPQYKKLEEAYGPDRAAIAFHMRGDGGIPTVDEAADMLGIKPGEKTLQQKNYADFLKEKKYTPLSFKESINKSFKENLDEVKDVTKSMTKMLLPSAFEGKDRMATTMKIIMREAMGIKHFEDLRTEKLSDKLRRYWHSRPFNDHLSFMELMEHPERFDISTDPKIKSLYDNARGRYDAIFNGLSAIKDVNYIEDYFSHFWKQPKKNSAFFSAMSKRPMQGSKSFLRKRFFADIQEGLKAGLELISTNPEENLRIAELNYTKFKMANDVFDFAKEKGILKFVKGSEKPPEGYDLVNDDLFKRRMPFVKMPSEEAVAMAKEAGLEVKPEGAMMYGGWYMPSDAALIVNNHLSRGLSGIPGLNHVYQLGTRLNNIKNTFQLGFSLFHLVGTTVDATVSTIGNGLVKASTGKPKNIKNGLIDIARGFSIIGNVSNAYAIANPIIKDAYLGIMSKDVEMLARVNGRVSAEKFWQVNARDNFLREFGKIKNGEIGVTTIPRAVWEGLLIVPELASDFIMKYHVPTLKVAGFINAMRTWEVANPNATEESRRLAEIRAWDDQDDRLGLVTYDNLFINKAIKDVAFLTIRSFGWTGGTIKAIAKGIGEAFPKKVGESPKSEGFSQRTAWLIALAGTVGLFGAMYHYIMTGQWPEELKDYYFPKDGTKNPDGTDRRVAFPTYMKDLYSYTGAPMQTIMSKTAPFLNELFEIWSNKDFYGQQIYDEDDDVFKRGLDILKYELKSFEPFGFRNKPGEQEQPILSKQSIESKVGLTSAPSQFTRTGLEEAINQEIINQYSKEKREPKYTPDQGIFRKLSEGLLKQGMTFDELDADTKAKAGLTDQQGNIKSPSAVKSLIKGAQLTKAQKSFSYLKPEHQIDVIRKLNDDEFKELIGDKDLHFIIKPRPLIQLRRTNPEFFAKKPDRIKAFEKATGMKFDDAALPKIDISLDNEEK